MPATKPHILVCVLCGDERSGWLNPSLLPSLIKLTQSPLFHVTVETVMKRPVALARNYAVTRARAENAAWLVMIDNDQCLPPNNGLLDVIAHAGPQQDVIGLPSAMVGDTGLRWNANFLETPNGQPFIKVEMIGAGVLILRNTVWKRLSVGPWFETHFRNDGELGQTLSGGEDISFCKLANDAGLGIWASQFASPHLKTVDITAQLIEKHRQLQNK